MAPSRSRSSKFTKTFHLCLAFHYFVYGIHLLWNVLTAIFVKAPAIWDNILLVPLQYASFWAISVQIIYVFLAWIEDIIESKTESHWESFKLSLHDFQDVFFTCYVVPIPFVIGVNFWPLFLYDISLIEEFGLFYECFSPTVNHVLHSLPMLIVLIEMYTNYRPYPQPMSRGFKHCTSALAVHLTLSLVSQQFSTRWTYPFYGLMSTTLWIFFIVAHILLMNGLYYVGYLSSRALWHKTKTS